MKESLAPLPSRLEGWSPARIQEAIDARVARLNEIAGDDFERLSSSEVREMRSLNDEIDRLRESQPQPLRDMNGKQVALFGSSDWTPGGPFLSRSEPIAPYLRASAPRRDGYRPEAVRFGALIAAIAGGPKVADALNSSELMALTGMGTLTGPGGGYLIPSEVVGPFIDSVRPLTRVIEAGALTMPMSAHTVRLPGWDTPLTAGWRGEGSSFSQVTPPVRQVNLIAKSVGCRVTLSTELLEDAAGNLGGVESIIEFEVAKAIAQAIDLAALMGTGVDAQPLGILNTPGVTTDSTLGANGGTPSNYDFLLEAIGLVGSGNFEANAVLYSARTAKTLSKLKTGLASDQTQLRVPDPLASMRRLVTNQITDTNTKGSSGAVCSYAFTGQWDQLVIGIRSDLQVIVDPYSSAGTGEITLTVWQRADVALLNKAAFIVSDGIKP